MFDPSNKATPSTSKSRQLPTVATGLPQWTRRDEYSFDPAQKRLALVYTPWARITSGAIGLSILKRCAVQLGYPTDVHYLTIKLAERVGLDTYDNVSRNSALGAEWFFSRLLFGDAGLGLLKNEWHDLALTEDGQMLADELVRLTGGVDQCKRLVETVIPQFVEDVLVQIPWDKYDFIGFSVTYSQSMAALLLAKRLRELYPEKIFAMGGSSVDDEMGFEILKACNWIDYVVHGEAENVFPQLLHNVFSGNRFDPIPGVSFRNNGNVTAGYQTARPIEDTNQCPVPDYSDYMAEVHRVGLDKSFKIRLQFESARGCWWGAKHHCTFCGLNRNIIAFRKKEPERVYDEIMFIAKQYRCMNLYAVDFIMDPDYFNNLLPRLADANLDLSLFYEIKANLTREQVRKLARAGITTIQPGIESFSTDILKLMRKGVTGIQNVQLLKWCAEEGIDARYNLLFGFPGEQAEQYSVYPKLMPSLVHLQAPGAVNPVLFERFSPYDFEREKLGVTLKPNPFYRLLYPEGSVDFDRLAYFFEGYWDKNGSEPAIYSQPVKELTARWKRLRAQKSVCFFYEKGPDFLVLYDNRPFGSDESLQLRRIKLNRIQSLIYTYCDERRSFASILKMLESHVKEAAHKEAIEGLLTQFVNKRLMMQEGDQYLSLAVRHTSAYEANFYSARREATNGYGTDD